MCLFYEDSFYQGTYSLSHSSFKVPLSLQSICKGPQVIGSTQGSSFTCSCDSRVLPYVQKVCPTCFPKASLFICCIWFGAKGPQIHKWDNMRVWFGCGRGCQGGSWHCKSRRFCAEKQGGILSCQGKWWVAEGGTQQPGAIQVQGLCWQEVAALSFTVLQFPFAYLLSLEPFISV